MEELPLLEWPEHMEGHRYVIHVAGWLIPGTDDLHPEWRYQWCMRCGCCLNVITQNSPNILETGVMIPYIVGPTYNGSQAITPTLLVLGDLCEREAWTPYRPQVPEDWDG